VFEKIIGRLTTVSEKIILMCDNMLSIYLANISCMVKTYKSLVSLREREGGC
jgi:hypothetical protein